jgi:hypothetical protein
MGSKKSSRSTLRVGMTLAEFESAYYYAEELKAFARDIGVAIGNFRKNELENLIREYLTTGHAPSRKAILPRKSGAPRDALSPKTLVINYVGDRKTKDFLRGLVRVKDAGIRDKSGQWYWLNDWRRQQQGASRRFTYQDLAGRLAQLMSAPGRLPQIPSARMNNFLSDFRADPANKQISRDDALKAWERLKAHFGPKTYEEYKRKIAKRDSRSSPG